MLKFAIQLTLRLVIGDIRLSDERKVRYARQLNSMLKAIAEGAAEGAVKGASDGLRK